MTAELYLDTENVFRGTSARAGAPLDGRPSVQAEFEQARSKRSQPLAVDMVRQALELTIKWAVANDAANDSRVHSYGKRSDPAVRAFRAAVTNTSLQDVNPLNLHPDWALIFDKTPVTHVDVGREQHAAERALLKDFDTHRAGEFNPSVVVIGSADHEAIVAFDHAASYDNLGILVVLPPQAFNVLRHFTRYGRYSSIPSKSVRTINEILAGRMFSNARNAQYGRAGKELAEKRRLLQVKNGEDRTIIADCLGYVARIDIVSLGRSTPGSRDWERALGSHWVRVATSLHFEQVLSEVDILRYARAELSTDEEVSLISQCIVWQVLDEHPELQSAGLLAYARGLKGTRLHERLLPAVNRVLALRDPSA